MPRALHVGPKNGPKVWIVDDAWFTGTNRYGTNSIIQYGFGITDQEKEVDFGVLDDIITVSKQRLERISEDSLTWSGDWICLEDLFRLCKKKEVRITFCSFEYFESHFDEINKVGNAVLLDVNYAKLPPREAEAYGIMLLHRLLEGKRFRGDIFFFTSFLHVPHDLATEHSRNDPHWWPIRFIPTVPKLEVNDGAEREKFRSNLESFLEYFRQGLPRDKRILLKQLAESLAIVNPHNDSITNRDNRTWPCSHPSSADQIDPFFLLQGEYAQHLDSFKAFYHYDDCDGFLGGKGSREMKASTFAAHLSYLGIEYDHKGAETFCLPVQPGLIFLINLLNFVLELDDEEKHRVELTVNDTKNDGDTPSAILSIELRDPIAFRNAWYIRPSGTGGAVTAFRRLIHCSKEVFKELNPLGRGEILDKIWYSPYIGDARVPWVCLEPEFINEDGKRAVTLGWNWELGDR